jgi:hypothetical protein
MVKWKQTYFHVVEYITLHPEKVEVEYENGGIHALYDLAEELTNNFEDTYEETGEYLTDIENYLEKTFENV